MKPRQEYQTHLNYITRRMLDAMTTNTQLYNGKIEMNEDTEIYDGEQKPVRVGVYKRNYASMGWPDNKKDNWLYCWWDGEWKIGAGTPQEAGQDNTTAAPVQNLPWKGLSHEGSVFLKPVRPNKEGATLCIVRWLLETPDGWVGAYDFEAIMYLQRASLKGVCVEDTGG